MCTAMLYDPKDHYEPEETKEFFKRNVKGLERLLKFKQWKLLKPFMKKIKKEMVEAVSLNHYCITCFIYKINA